MRPARPGSACCLPPWGSCGTNARRPFFHEATLYPGETNQNLIFPIPGIYRSEFSWRGPRPDLRARPRLAPAARRRATDRRTGNPARARETGVGVTDRGGVVLRRARVGTKGALGMLRFTIDPLWPIGPAAPSGGAPRATAPCARRRSWHAHSLRNTICPGPPGHPGPCRQKQRRASSRHCAL